MTRKRSKYRPKGVIMDTVGQLEKALDFVAGEIRAKRARAIA